MPLTTLLFDLDGTLLPLDLDKFLESYFKLLLSKIGHLDDPVNMRRAILSATQQMIDNEDASVSNMDVFRAAFRRLSTVPMDEIWPLFEEFYFKDFGTLRQVTEPNHISREICLLAIDKGYRLVVATNPVFPEMAVRHRMAWAGISDIPFALVTTMEDMHFCKPNPKYYVEIMDKLGVSPQECIMFGNDVQEDGVAGNVGMLTYLVTNCLIDRQMGHLEFNFHGRLEDVLTFVQGLPSIE